MSLRWSEIVVAADELNALSDGGVQKAWATSGHDCVLSIRKNRQTVLVRVVAHATLGRLSVVDERPRLSKGPPGLQFVLRNELVGSRFERVRLDAEHKTASLRFVSERGVWRLRASFAPAALTLVKDPTPTGTVADSSPTVDVDRPAPAQLTFPGARALEQALERDAGAQEQAAEQRVERADLTKLRRTIARVEADLAKTQQAEQLRREGELLVSQQHLIKRGAKEVTLDSYADDGTRTQVTISLDPSKSPKENVERRFHQYRRMQRGAAVVTARLEALRSELREREQQLEAAAAPERTGHEAPPVKSISGRRDAQPKALPYHAFRGHGAAVILVGRGAKANDALTLKVARPHDYWLHARGTAGAHVVLRCEKGQVPTPEALADAAMLAAHHSPSRGEAKVEVSYTPVRFVRKPKGAAPGLVLVDREKTMLVRVDAERLRELLATKAAGRE